MTRRSRQGDQEALAEVDYDHIGQDHADKAAVCFVIDGKDVWLPRSQISWDEQAKAITMPEWLANKRGLI